MEPLNWTKTDAGYAAGIYQVNRTPGRRWVVLVNGEQLAGPALPRLADAQALAQELYNTVQAAAPEPPPVDDDNDPDDTPLLVPDDLPAPLGPPVPVPPIDPAMTADFVPGERLGDLLARLDDVRATLPRRGVSLVRRRQGVAA